MIVNGELTNPPFVSRLKLSLVPCYFILPQKRSATQESVFYLKGEIYAGEKK